MAKRYRLKHQQLAAELSKMRYSQNRWAQVLGLGRGHLSLLLNGKRPYPTAETRRKLVEGLGVPFSTLFEIEDVPLPGSDRPRHLAWIPRSAPEPVTEMVMGTLAQDLRFAARTLAARPLFTGVVVLMLALGIGANTAMFSWINGLLLEPLRVETPERWMQLNIVSPSGFRSSYSYPNFLDHRDRNEVFDEMYAARTAAISVSFGGDNERSTAMMVSGAFFRALGGQPEIGRAFYEPEDEVPGRDLVAVISHGFWQRRFDGDPGVVGREFLLNAQPFTILGVMPEGFGFARLEVDADLWVPVVLQEIIRPGTSTIDERGSGFLQVYGRMRPGVTQEQAFEGMNAMHAGLVEEFPNALGGSTVGLTPATRATLGPNADAVNVLFAVLMAVVGSVLLIACVNVANLMLARGSDRRQEIGIRMALGAGRRRVVRQLLTESLLLAGAAGIAGIGVGLWINSLVSAFEPPLPFPITIEIPLDTRVLAFTTVAAVLTGVLFGLLPALRASRPDVVATLRGGGQRVAAGGRLRQVMVAGQVALSLTLLIGAGLFVRSLQNASTIDVGFDPGGLVVATIDPGLQGYGDEERATFYRRLADEAAAVPGIDSVSLAEALPMSLSNQQWGAQIEGYEPAPDERMNIDYNFIGPDYFRTMGIALVAGREFTWSDDLASEGVVIVNETMAGRFWPGESALGRRLRSGGMWRTVVGVATDSKYYSIGEDPLAFQYFPFLQSSQTSMALHARGGGDPAAIVDAIRGTVRALDPNLPLFDVRTMSAQVGIALLPARMSAGLLGAFGGLALLLAAVGLYGAMAYTVGRRTREIGVRMALGAARGDLVRMVMRQASVVLAAGLVLGVLGGAAIGRAIQGLLYGVSGLDLPAFAAAVAVIGGSVLVAAALPARRATRVDPVRALRSQ